MTDLVEWVRWLRTQLDIEERIAQVATSGPWSADTSMATDAVRSASASIGDFQVWVADCAHERMGPLAQANARHIATFDPVRVLRQVRAHRAILDDYDRAFERRRQYPDDLASACDLLSMVRTVKRLLPIYSDRDGYQEEWDRG